MTAPLPDDASEAGAAAARLAVQIERDALELPAGHTWFYVNRHRALVRELKLSARRLTRRAVKDGLVRPRPPACERCGVKPERPELIHAHHLDYFDPFAIAWLCPGCHSDQHVRPIDWPKLYDLADHAA